MVVVTSHLFPYCVLYFDGLTEDLRTVCNPFFLTVFHQDVSKNVCLSLDSGLSYCFSILRINYSTQIVWEPIMYFIIYEILSWIFHCKVGSPMLKLKLYILIDVVNLLWFRSWAFNFSHNARCLNCLFPCVTCNRN